MHFVPEGLVMCEPPDRTKTTTTTTEQRATNASSSTATNSIAATSLAAATATVTTTATSFTVATSPRAVSSQKRKAAAGGDQDDEYESHHPKKVYMRKHLRTMRPDSDANSTGEPDVLLPSASEQPASQRLAGVTAGAISLLVWRSVNCGRRGFQEALDVD